MIYRVQLLILNLFYLLMTALYRVINPLINYWLTARLINRELLNVCNWLISNKICINALKTKYIVITYNKNINLPLIKLGKHIIKETNNTKFLGVCFDKNLKFDYHIEYISGKICKSVGVLYRLKNFLPASILELIYLTFIVPYFTYGIEA